MATIRIIIADSYRLFREGIKSLGSNESDIEFIADAEDDISLIKLLIKVKPNIIVLGPNVPHLRIIDIATHISKDFPDIGIIVLSVNEEAIYISKCVQSGVKAYLLKNIDRNEFIFAIRKVANGQKYFNNELDRLLQLGIIKQRFNNIKLSSREKQVIEGVSSGLSTKQISEKLFLSTRTIESHRLSLLQKFGVHNSIELIKMAKEQLFII